MVARENPSQETSNSSETRDRILAAAEKLFSLNGFGSTSVRDITSEAGCNVAAVNYHFGGKDALYRETFRNLLLEINERRIAAIRRDMAANPGTSLEGFLESFANAFMEPFVDESRGRLFMSFFVREMIDPHLPREMILKDFVHPFLAVSMSGLERVGPPMDIGSRVQCFMSLVGQLLQILHFGRLAAGSEMDAMFPQSLEERIQHVVRFSAGGIRALSEASS